LLFVVWTRQTPVKAKFFLETYDVNSGRDAPEITDTWLRCLSARKKVARSVLKFLRRQVRCAYKRFRYRRVVEVESLVCELSGETSSS